MTADATAVAQYLRVARRLASGGAWVESAYGGPDALRFALVGHIRNAERLASETAHSLKCVTGGCQVRRAEDAERALVVPLHPEVESNHT